jgi:glyoxylase-like metal-dependent hydrolase (beta-lactamase superfamily II)
VRRPSYLACSYLARFDGNLVSIDAGMDSGGADLFAALETLGFSPTELKAVLLTHWHNDHAAGAAAMQSQLNVPVYYSAIEEPFFTRATAKHGIRGWLGEKIPELGVLVLLRGLLEEAPPLAVKATSLLADGDVVEGGFRVIASGGHTEGHIAYFHEKSGVLFCGDAMAVVGGRLQFMARPVTLDQAAARASVVRCLDLKPKIVCPGHRAPLTKNVAAEVVRFRALAKSDAPWPLLG